MATDITMHHDGELADWFDNDEYLYSQARAASRFSVLEELAGDLFKFTEDQLNEFHDDWESGRWD